MNHVRIFRQAPERRIGRTATAMQTLCGSPVTDRDMLVRDARKDLLAGWKFLECDKCKSIIEMSGR